MRTGPPNAERTCAGVSSAHTDSAGGGAVVGTVGGGDEIGRPTGVEDVLLDRAVLDEAVLDGAVVGCAVDVVDAALVVELDAGEPGAPPPAVEVQADVAANSAAATAIAGRDPSTRAVIRP